MLFGACPPSPPLIKHHFPIQSRHTVQPETCNLSQNLSNFPPSLSPDVRTVPPHPVWVSTPYWSLSAMLSHCCLFMDANTQHQKNTNSLDVVIDNRAMLSTVNHHVRESKYFLMMRIYMNKWQQGYALCLRCNVCCGRKTIFLPQEMRLV